MDNKTCDVFDCQTEDRKGTLEIGDLTFHICKAHYVMVTSEGQIGLVKRAHITIDSKGLHINLKGENHDSKIV